MELVYKQRESKRMVVVYKGASYWGLSHTVMYKDGSKLRVHGHNLQLLKQPDFKNITKTSLDCIWSRDWSYATTGLTPSKTNISLTCTERVCELVSQDVPSDMLQLVLPSNTKRPSWETPWVPHQASYVCGLSVWPSSLTSMEGEWKEKWFNT